MTSPDIVATENRRFDRALNWVVRAIGALAIALVLGVMIFAGDTIVHGHPAHWVLLAVTLVIALVAVTRSFFPRKRNSSLRRFGRSVLVVFSLGGLALVGWLTPAGATAPGLQALVSSEQVTVIEDPVQISFVPAGQIRPTGVLFQPGAKVDARAYAKTLRPLAENGHVVVIAKQPLGVGFLAMTALDSARTSFPDIPQWVVGGHSLGGTAVAAQASADLASTGQAPIVGLFFYASYPASDLTALGIPVLSISGEKDMLSTPETIESSRTSLPSSTTFIQVRGATHAFFGDYGLQAGDGTATVSHDNALAEISRATLDWVNARD